MKNNRRQFMILTAAGAATFAFNGKVQAQVMLSSSDPQAMSLGYVTDHLNADKTKFPNFVAGSRCNMCTLSRRPQFRLWSLLPISRKASG